MRLWRRECGRCRHRRRSWKAGRVEQDGVGGLTGRCRDAQELLAQGRQRGGELRSRLPPKRSQSQFTKFFKRRVLTLKVPPAGSVWRGLRTTGPEDAQSRARPAEIRDGPLDVAPGRILGEDGPMMTSVGSWPPPVLRAVGGQQGIEEVAEALDVRLLMRAPGAVDRRMRTPHFARSFASGGEGLSPLFRRVARLGSEAFRGAKKGQTPGRRLHAEDVAASSQYRSWADQLAVHADHDGPADRAVVLVGFVGTHLI